MRILIADDDPVSRRLLEAALVRMGHTVVVVSEGLAAIDALVAVDGPRIAILDWMMPGADGLAVCRAVRQRATPYVYVILLTARHSQADMVAALDAEADEFLTKPFDAIELRGRLHAGERILQLQEGLLLARDALQHQASHDHLTGLWNRRMALQQLERELQRSARDRSELAVILADVDHFKRINDTYGHATGDAVLQEVAGRLRSVVRDHEYLARYGGEEFLILLPGCPAVNAVGVAERARASIAADPVMVGGLPVSVRISLGVASTAEAGIDAAVLIASADAALYQAKAGGRNRVGSHALATTA
jgi:two-component system, cell cycle response regulator